LVVVNITPDVLDADNITFNISSAESINTADPTVASTTNSKVPNRCKEIYTAQFT
jgi:hypothetical protein